MQVYFRTATGTRYLPIVGGVETALQGSWNLSVARPPHGLVYVLTGTGWREPTELALTFHLGATGGYRSAQRVEELRALAEQADALWLEDGDAGWVVDLEAPTRIGQPAARAYSMQMRVSWAVRAVYLVEPLTDGAEALWDGSEELWVAEEV